MKVGARLAAAVGLALAGAGEVRAQAEPFIGQIMMTGASFCPRGWVEADGQLLSIASNTALFSLYGVSFGGDGRTTFALPDLRGRSPIGFGQGPGLSAHPLGASGGAEQQTLSTAQMPTHTHEATAALNAAPTPAATPAPGGALLALSTPGPIYAVPAQGQPTAAMAAEAVTASVAPTGGGAPFGIVSPFLAIRYCVALQGVFPSRN